MEFPGWLRESWLQKGLGFGVSGEAGRAPTSLQIKGLRVGGGGGTRDKFA